MPFLRSIRLFVLAFCLAICAASPSFALNAREFYASAQKYRDIHPFAATCHSAHETGNWTSELWKNARNGAGIKADDSWIKAGKPTYRKRSKEAVGKRTVNKVSHFRAYPSLQAFQADYRTKIVSDYPLASKHSNTMWGYFASLQKGRHGAWATNKKYFEQLTDKAIALAPQVLGSKWKSQLTREYAVARSKKSLSKSEIAVIKRKFKAAGIPLK